MSDTAAIAFSEASQNVSSYFFRDFLRFGVITRGMWMFSKTCNDDFQWFHCDFKGSVNGSSQFEVSETICLRICLPIMITGARKPSGSYRLLTVDRTPLLDKGLSSVEY